MINQTESIQQQRNNIYERFPQILSSIKIDINISGIYAFPEEWKTLDDANPGLFGYGIRFYESDLWGARIIPRELTAREKREQEEQAALKNKKAPPAGKKDQNKDIQLNLEEEEQLRLKREEEEQQELKKQQELDSLDQEQRFWRICEDRFKSQSIQYEKNQLIIDRVGRDLSIFEEHVLNDGGEYIFFVRQAQLNEDDLNKLKKSKPKTVPNLNELIPIVMKGWINLSQFQNEGVTEIVQRVRLEQYIDEASPAETPKPNLDSLYVLLKFRINQPMVGVQENKIKFQDIIQLAPGVAPIDPSQLCIMEFRDELVLIIESLAMEYSNMFSKELNLHHDLKYNNMMLIHKKQDLQKRKEHFLYDFNISGKYKILKERIKKSIVKICRDKFGKSGSITGITTGQQDQFYSELYVFLMDEMRKMILQLVDEKKEALMEDQLLTKQFAQKNINNILESNTKETKFQQLSRLAEEYEILNKMDVSNQYFKQLLDLNITDHNSLFQYSLFSLRAKNYLVAEQYLEKALSYNNDNSDYQYLLSAIYLRKEQYKDAYIITRLLLERDNQNLYYNLMCYLIATKIFSNDQNKIIKLKTQCERIYMRQLNLITPIRTHRIKPNIYDLPWIKIPIQLPEKPEKGALEKLELQKQAIELLHQSPKLNFEQLDEMILQILSYFDKFYLYDLVDKYLNHISNKSLPQVVLMQAKIQAHKKNVVQALSIMDQYLETNARDYNVILAKGNLQYQFSLYDESEISLLRALKLPQGKTTFSLYLRLGYLYLKSRQFGNARAFLTKACELKSISSLSWLGLGISCYKCSLHTESEYALNQANLYELTNPEIWAYIALNALESGNKLGLANQALRELKKIDIINFQFLKQNDVKFDYVALLSDILALDGIVNNERQSIFDYLEVKMQNQKIIQI